MTRDVEVRQLRQVIRKGSLGPALPDFAERLRLRQSAGLSRRQVAEALGVSERAVWLWETRQDPRNLGLPRAYRRLLEAFRTEGSQR